MYLYAIEQLSMKSNKLTNLTASLFDAFRSSVKQLILAYNSLDAVRLTSVFDKNILKKYKKNIFV
jgi:hypothetical protein